MTADEAKVITTKAVQLKVERWYENFKEKLFSRIQKCAEGESYTLTIDQKDELNDVGFITYEPLRNKLKKEVENLGYKFQFCNSQQGEYVSISWE